MSGNEEEQSETRSDRLRRRRGSRGQSTQQSGVKAEREGVYMYLTQQQKKQVERLYNVLKAEYEYEFDQDFEKNRHFYPLLIQHGLDGLDELDASDVRELLDNL